MLESLAHCKRLGNIIREVQKFDKLHNHIFQSKMKSSMEDDYSRAMLIIKPLAPLSMVTSVPGSFYRSSQEPTDSMIYGMLENMLGWHYSPEIRKAIKKDVVKKLKKIKGLYKNFISESGYEPVIQKYVRISKLFVKPASLSFTDLWTQHQKHNDKRHFDGVRNYDWRLTKQINVASNDAEKADLLKNNISHFPNYYQSPKRREYLLVQGNFVYEIEVANVFIEQLFESVNNPISPAFLGTSEGWVDVKIEIV